MAISVKSVLGTSLLAYETPPTTDVGDIYVVGVGNMKWGGAAYVSVLGTAASKDITTSPTDTTSGHLLKVGDGGWMAPIAIPGATDLNSLIVPGRYNCSNSGVAATLVNSPTTIAFDLDVRKSGANGGGVSQHLTTYTGPRVFVRSYNGSGVWSNWVELYHSGNLVLNPWAVKVIGEPFPLDPDAPPPPTNDPNYRYIVLTAGLTGAGQYNAGVLTGETVTGSTPLVVATAVVSLAGSPKDGKAVHLINTEGRFVGAGVGEAFEDDTFQGHAHFDPPWVSQLGASNGMQSGSGYGYANRTGTGGTYPSGADGTPRVSDHTQPRAHRLPHYMRIK